MCQKIICSVFKSQVKPGMYLYVEKSEIFKKVPLDLQRLFGQPELAMTIVLTAEKRLAAVKSLDVMQMIEDKGFYLQMPTVEDDDMKIIAEKNSKLSLG